MLVVCWQEGHPSHNLTPLIFTGFLPEQVKKGEADG